VAKLYQHFAGHGKLQPTGGELDTLEMEAVRVQVVAALRKIKTVCIVWLVYGSRSVALCRHSKEGIDRQKE